MTQEEAFTKIVLFLYLITLNERKTLELSVKASQLYQLRQDNEGSRFESELALIQICDQLISKLSPQEMQSTSSGSPNFLNWPEHFDFLPWREFQSKSSLQERVSIAGIIVLRFNLEKFAQALNLTEGAIRYRVNKGLSLLGQLNQPQFNHSQFNHSKWGAT